MDVGTPRWAGWLTRAGPFGTRLYDAYMHSRAIIRALEPAGWTRVAQKGSHVQFKHLERSGPVTVPHPSRDVPIGTLRSIEKQSGLKLR